MTMRTPVPDGVEILLELSRPHVVILFAANVGGDASVTLRGDGSPTREILFLEDAADAVFAAAKR